MPSRSQEQLADKLDLLRSLDTHADFRRMISLIGQIKEEWAGIPMPLEDNAIIVEPTYPHADKIMNFYKPKEEAKDPEIIPADSIKIRNRFHSRFKGRDIIIFEENGKIDWTTYGHIHHFDNDLATLGASVAWGIEQEAKAVQLLGTLLRHHCFKQYLLTGMFLETSKRSGVTYVFRKLRPTVALRLNEARPRILTTLCMHPIAYYEGSWAGAMCPTDDVIAALVLMRGDESMLWKRANHHPAWRPEAGL